MRQIALHFIVCVKCAEKNVNLDNLVQNTNIIPEHVSHCMLKKKWNELEN